ncbi:MAG: hypothetical protein ACRENB_14020 [Gemmatimonadales bacterium]
MSSPLALFISPGRSGTQWAAARLRAGYGGSAEVLHEQIGPEYRPKVTLRTGRYQELIDAVEPLRCHLEFIRATVERGKPYIEAGWPVFSWIPWFIERYASHVRLVHLTRHPVQFAYSLQSHGYHSDTRADWYVRYAQLDPYDPGILHTEYRDRWASLTGFEKCLFQWIELNEYALELRRTYPDVPFLHVRMEDLVGNAGRLRELGEFLGLPPAPPADETDLRKRVDEFQHRMDRIVDPRRIHDHPAALRLAAEFGYDVDDVDLRAVRRRYQRPWTERLARSVRRVARRLTRLYGRAPAPAH